MAIKESIYFEKLNNTTFYIWRIKDWKLLIEIIEPGKYKLTFPEDPFIGIQSRYYNHSALVERLSDLFTCEYNIVKDKIRDILIN